MCAVPHLPVIQVCALERDALGDLDMKALHSAALGALCVLALFGCASTPPYQEVLVENYRIVPRPFDVVWDEFIEHLAAKHIHIKTMSKADGFIDTAFQTLPEHALGDYAWTVGPPASMISKGRAKANIYVRKLSERSVEVVVNSRMQLFEDRINRSFRGGWREANSTGKFEAEFLDIARRIAESGQRADGPAGQARDGSK